jgi:hypothetical protein
MAAIQHNLIDGWYDLLLNEQPKSLRDIVEQINMLIRYKEAHERT